MCFSFYILSFITFYFTKNFGLAVLGMALFGLGDAFRSGTHKAMIFTYLDSKNWQEEKTFVYGRTRSFSLIGSAVSGVLAIVIILIVPNDNYVFLFSIVPYVLDAILIVSYPKFLDVADRKSNASVKQMLANIIGNFRVSKKLGRLIVEEGLSEATYSYMKDLIQPILEIIIVGSGIAVITGLTSEQNLKVMLGAVYVILNLSGAFFSKRTYLIKGNKSSLTCLFFIHIMYAIILGGLAVFSGEYLVVCVLYIVIYVSHSIRKPLYVDEVDRHMNKELRATILSVTSQLKSIFLIIMAPLLGFVADTFSIGIAIGCLAVVFILTSTLLKYSKKNSNNK